MRNRLRDARLSEIPPGPGSVMTKIFRLTVSDKVRTLPGATATFVFRDLYGDDLPAVIKTADPDGRISCAQQPDEFLVEVIVDGGPGVWSMRYTEASLPGKAVCLPLPEEGPIGWWHKTLGVKEFDPESGAGIRVGVIDTGMAAHRDLSHVSTIGTVFGGRITADSGDLAGHGTHVTGLIGSRPHETGYAGIAPGATILVARVCDREAEFRSSDVARAVNILAGEEVDIINLSLGSREVSETLREAIQNAFDKGVLCIAAAGNSPEPPQSPACFDEVVAVGAFGKKGWGPPHSHARACEPINPEPLIWDDLFRPHFTAIGDGLDMVAPGVGLISTVPDGSQISHSYLAMTGTSMAAPLVSGVLAVLLARDEGYAHMPRNSSRAARAREILNASRRTLDLPEEFQGGGIPRVHALGSR